MKIPRRYRIALTTEAVGFIEVDGDNITITEGALLVWLNQAVVTVLRAGAWSSVQASEFREVNDRS
jgi:hypothetical protein